MLGDQQAQRIAKINTAFIKRLVPPMREASVKRLLYQSSAMTAPYGAKQNTVLWLMRKTLESSYHEQYRDNEGVGGIWSRRRLISSRSCIVLGLVMMDRVMGVLGRTHTWPSVGTSGDCAEYNYRMVMNPNGAVHTQDLSQYQ